MKLELPAGIPAVGAGPDTIPQARQEAIEAALGCVYARTTATLRPTDFASVEPGPWRSTLDLHELKLPTLRWGSPDRQTAHALLGSSDYIGTDESLETCITLVWIARKHDNGVRFDVWLSAPDNSETVEPKAESVTAVTGKDAGDTWQSGAVIVSAPPMRAHRPILLTITRKQPDQVDLLLVNMSVQPRDE